MSLRRIVAGVLMGLGLLGAEVRAESVVLRDASGRFLTVAPDGLIQAGPKIPGEQETFELSTHGDRITLKDSQGRRLSPRPADRRLAVWVETAQAMPSAVELVALPEHRTALRVAGTNQFVRFAPPGKPEPKSADAQPKPTDTETVEVFLIHQTPEGVRDVLTSLLQKLADKELKGEKYDKTRRKKKEKFVTLPAPTLNDPKRQKRHRVYATHEISRVQAELAGPLTIDIAQMPYLRRYGQTDSRLLLFLVQADVPAKGRVYYKVPSLLDISTSYRARTALAVTGQVPEVQSADDLKRRPPELLQLDIKLLSLDLGNDLLQTAHKPIRDLINKELRRRRDKIGEKANKSIRKALAKLPSLGIEEEPATKKPVDKKADKEPADKEQVDKA
ncbi:MAG: hypothetical protein JW818_04865 [Pirellulales bacterium]|nr:hypothetical protein [Pirellulales bacterium]